VDLLEATVVTRVEALEATEEVPGEAKADTAVELLVDLPAAMAALKEEVPVVTEEAPVAVPVDTEEVPVVAPVDTEDLPVEAEADTEVELKEDPVVREATEVPRPPALEVTVVLPVEAVDTVTMPPSFQSSSSRRPKKVTADLEAVLEDMVVTPAVADMEAALVDLPVDTEEALVALPVDMEALARVAMEELLVKEAPEVTAEARVALEAAVMAGLRAEAKEVTAVASPREEDMEEPLPVERPRSDPRSSLVAIKTLHPMTNSSPIGPFTQQCHKYSSHPVMTTYDDCSHRPLQNYVPSTFLALSSN